MPKAGKAKASPITLPITLDRDDKRFPDSDERDFSVWISDDAGCVPLQNIAKTDYGDMKMEITDYQSGNGTPLRQ